MTRSAEPPACGVDRRLFIATVAAGAAGVAALGSAASATPPPSAKGLEDAFRRALAPSSAGGLDVAARLAFLLPEASVIDHDVPFPMDVPAYADHLGFHAAQWERVETALSDLKIVDHRDAAVVSCFYNERGKPKNAGFRLRAGFCTALCVSGPGGWKALSLHMAPLSAQILDASPS